MTALWFDAIPHCGTSLGKAVTCHRTPNEILATTQRLGVENEFSMVAFFKSNAAFGFRSAGWCSELMMVVMVSTMVAMVSTTVAMVSTTFAIIRMITIE